MWDYAGRQNCFTSPRSRPPTELIDGATGEVRSVIEPKSGAHNTSQPRRQRVYLAGLRSPLLTVPMPNNEERGHRRAFRARFALYD